MNKRKARVIMREHQEGFIKLNPRWCAIEELISDSEKLEKIEKIMAKYQDTMDNFYSGKPRDLLESDVLRDIEEVLKQE